MDVTESRLSGGQAVELAADCQSDGDSNVAASGLAVGVTLKLTAD